MGDVAAEAAWGSEIGIRRSLARLVEEGIVVATQMGRNKVHELNRDHVAAPVAGTLAGLRLELWSRLREAFAQWQPRPVYACVFGSAARGDGGPESDIDILIVHRPLPTESRLPKSVLETLGELRAPSLTEQDEQRWLAQINRLHRDVMRWTGNTAHVLDVSVRQWWDGAEPELFDAARTDSITLTGVDLSPPRGGR